MITSPAGIAALTHEEGSRLHAYPDPATGGEPVTIGIGHTGGVKLGDTITLEQQDDLLREDLAGVEESINHFVKVPLTQGQFDALACLIFNVGAGAFERSTLLRKLNAGDYAGAADEFPRWDMAAGQHNPALHARRMRERAMFLAASAAPAPAPIPAQPEPAPAPLQGFPAGDADNQEHNMASIAGQIFSGVANALTGGLAGTLFEIVSPLLQSKITAELGRHTDDKTVAANVAEALVSAAVKATGTDNPIEAVVAVKADPAAMMPAIEVDIAKHLADMAPLFEKMHQNQRETRADDEASRNAASERQNKSASPDQDPFLTHAVVFMVAAILLVALVLIGVLMLNKIDAQMLLGFWITASTTAVGAYRTRIDHRYGSSQSSNANTAAMAELAMRNKP